MTRRPCSTCAHSCLVRTRGLDRCQPLKCMAPLHRWPDIPVHRWFKRRDRLIDRLLSWLPKWR